MAGLRRLRRARNWKLRLQRIVRGNIKIPGIGGWAHCRRQHLDVVGLDDQTITRPKGVRLATDQPSIIQRHTTGAVGILDEESTIRVGDAGMLSRDEFVAEDPVALRRATDRAPFWPKGFSTLEKERPFLTDGFQRQLWFVVAH
jgi:hypothetical protein